MLDNLSKKILKYMQSAPHPSETYYDFNDDLNGIAEAISSDKESVRAAVRFLNDKGYIKYGCTQKGQIYNFYLDHEGLRYSEFTWIARKEFLMKSILTPILVTILTNLVLNLWPTIWLWLQSLSALTR